MRKQRVAPIETVADRDTGEHPAITKKQHSTDELFIEQLGWTLSPQALALRAYIENEAYSYLKLIAPFSNDEDVILGYVVELLYGRSSCELTLHTVEQARIAIDEFIRAQVRAFVN